MCPRARICWWLSKRPPPAIFPSERASARSIVFWDSSKSPRAISISSIRPGLWGPGKSSLLPDRGQYTLLRTEVAGGPLGGDSDFYKLELRTSRFIKGFFQGHVLELGAGIGVVDTYGSSARVPLFDRWYLGGIDSLRGYRYREVGPVDQPRLTTNLVTIPGGSYDTVGTIASRNEPIGGSTYWVG